ncbi:MAG: copper transporter [Actinobacteria bacterium]|nr:copper transporter [Actinomycetota bacterium]
MIDFRYHLISLVAVFLALGLGILLGSAVLGENLTSRLRRAVEDVERSNDRLRAANAEMGRRIESDHLFAQQAEPVLVDNSLAGQEVVVFELARSDDELLSGVREAIETAGGSVASVVALSDRFALEDEQSVLDLARVAGTSLTDPGDLRIEAGALLGSRAADAGAPSRVSTGDRRLERMIEQLETLGFIEVNREGGDDLIPEDALFVIAGGGADQPPYDEAGFTASLAERLAARSAGVLAAEAREGSWGAASAVRADDEASARVATVDQADVAQGRIAVALGLDLAAEGTVGHWGSGPGSSGGVIPEPAPGG